MKNILVMGAAGQIGSELTPELRKIYGNSRVVASDIKSGNLGHLKDSGPFEYLDAMNMSEIAQVVKKYNIDTIYNLVALLSATGEKNPQLAWNINVGCLFNILEVARISRCAVFTPSSIGAFGPSTPKKNTPQDTIQRPTTIYGVSKVSGELLCDYYYSKYGVDTRGVRYPGIISNVTLPGGGTTDYAVLIFYEAIENKTFTCPLKSNTRMDMMYMPDAIKAAIQIMEADPSTLKHRNCFNVTAMSFDPKKLASEVRKHIPDFQISYDVNETLQCIADSWPDNLNDSAARAEWGWNPQYNLEKMTEDMIKVLSKRLKKN